MVNGDSDFRIIFTKIYIMFLSSSFTKMVAYLESIPHTSHRIRFYEEERPKKYKFLWLLLLLHLFLRFVIFLGPSQFQRSRQQQQERLLLLPILLLDWNHSISDKPIFLLLLHFLKSSVCLFYNVFLFCCTHPVPSSVVHFVGLAWQEHNRTLPRPNKFQWQ